MAFEFNTVINPRDVLDAAQEFRTAVLRNAHRIPKARQIADKLGNIETIIIEAETKEEDDLQERLPIDRPEPVEAELGEGGHRGRRRKVA